MSVEVSNLNYKCIHVERKEHLIHRRLALDKHRNESIILKLCSWSQFNPIIDSPWQRSSLHPLVSVQPETSLPGGGWWHWKPLWCGWAASMSKWQRKSLVWWCPLETESGGGRSQVELLPWSTCKPKWHFHIPKRFVMLWTVCLDETKMHQRPLL